MSQISLHLKYMWLLYLAKTNVKNWYSLLYLISCLVDVATNVSFRATVASSVVCDEYGKLGVAGVPGVVCDRISGFND